MLLRSKDKDRWTCPFCLRGDLSGLPSELCWRCGAMSDGAYSGAPIVSQNFEIRRRAVPTKGARKQNHQVFFVLNRKSAKLRHWSG